MAFLDSIERLIRKLRNDAPMAWRSSWAWESDNNNFVGINSLVQSTSVLAEAEAKDERIEAKPKDVMKELFGVKPNIDFANLDEKIKAIKKRRDFIKNELEQMTTEEDQALVWLESRKKGLKYLKEFTWYITNEEKVSQLLRRYKLTKAPLNQYHLAIPAEAVDEMEKYYKLWKKVANKKDKPEFIVIADIPKEQKKYRKDPILLATSPFGKYYFVLGAWDKEVAIMHELFFEDK